MITTEIKFIRPTQAGGNTWQYTVKNGVFIHSTGTRPTEKEARQAADADAQTATMFLRPTREGDHTNEQAD